jgi:hypothetical protein
MRRGYFCFVPSPRPALHHHKERGQPPQNLPPLRHIGSGEERLPVVPGRLALGEHVVDARLLPSVAARKEAAAPDRFADPFDPAGEEYQTTDAGEQPTDLDTSGLAVGVPEVRTPQHGDPWAVGQHRVKPSRVLFVASGNCCFHENTLAG